MVAIGGPCVREQVPKLRDLLTEVAPHLFLGVGDAIEVAVRENDRVVVAGLRPCHEAVAVLGGKALFVRHEDAGVGVRLHKRRGELADRRLLYHDHRLVGEAQPTHLHRRGDQRVRLARAHTVRDHRRAILKHAGDRRHAEGALVDLVLVDTRQGQVGPVVGGGDDRVVCLVVKVLRQLADRRGFALVLDFALGAENPVLVRLLDLIGLVVGGLGRLHVHDRPLVLAGADRACDLDLRAVHLGFEQLHRRPRLGAVHRPRLCRFRATHRKLVDRTHVLDRCAGPQDLIGERLGDLGRHPPGGKRDVDIGQNHVLGLHLLQSLDVPLHVRVGLRSGLGLTQLLADVARQVLVAGFEQARFGVDERAARFQRLRPSVGLGDTQQVGHDLRVDRPHETQ